MSFINMAPMDAKTYWICLNCGRSVIVNAFTMTPVRCQLCNEKCTQMTPDKYFELNPTTNHNS